MVAAIERAADSRWIRAKQLAESTEGTLEERLAQLRVSYRRELVSIGAAAGGTAAVPGIGTMTAVGLTATEVAWTATKSAEIVLAVAAVHGYTQAAPAQRRSWVMAVFADGVNFADPATTTTTTTATTMAEAGVGLKAVGARPSAAIQRLNSRLGRHLIARYGAQRTALLVSKLLPFGIGAAIGGAANYAMVGAVVDRANAFFSPTHSTPPPPQLSPAQLPPPPIAPTDQ